MLLLVLQAPFQDAARLRIVALPFEQAENGLVHGAAMYAQNPEGAQAGAGDAGPTAGAQGGDQQDDEVVDAEIVDDDKPKGDAS